jgi:two-component system, OmpR family, sensor histidine kinase BaeS
VKIFPKFFLSYWLSFCAVTLMIFAVGTYTFERDLFRFVTRIETAQLQTFASEIEYYYAEVQTWDFLKENPRMADLILRQRRSFDENLIILPKVVNETRRFRFSFNNNQDIERPGRLYLLDENLKIIVGNEAIIKEMTQKDDLDSVLNDRFILSPIYYEDSQIGSLALLVSERLYEAIDLAFARSNNQTLRFSAIAGLLFAAIISLILTMNITGPIRKLGRGTRGLISGEFKTRVSIQNRDELGKLSRDFNILAKTLDKNSESQKQWLADISHELRTPIAILKSELEAIDDGIREFDKETLQSLTHEVKRINNLVNDLYELTLADLGAMKYQMREMDISSCLKAVIETYRDRFKSSEIDLSESISEASIFLGDSYRLEQLFTNLIENTLRYTDSPGKLIIDLIEDNENIQITFSDSAPGVATDVIEKIFDRFFREELSRSREKGGAGLGLAICHEIVEAHSGEIKAEPSDLGGLSIQILLPRGDT